MSNLDELNQDAEELREFISKSNRARVKELLQRELIRLEQEISLVARENLKHPTEPEETTSEGKEAVQEEKEANKSPKLPSYTTKITSYGWDQSDKFVKIYITLPEVEKLTKEKITTNFTTKSMDVTVCDLDGKNYQLQILKLCHKIIPGRSYVKAKSGTLTVMLKKDSQETWADVVCKEKKDVKSSMDENKDPQDGIMDLMKKMYSEGDDEMKKTITKAWLESRDKAGTGSGL